MERGWIRLWRKLTDSALFADESMLKLAIYCLCRATTKTQHVKMLAGRTHHTVTLAPGQLVVGRQKLADELGWPQSTAWKRLKRLAEPPFEFVTAKSNSNYTIVTICNWYIYQPNSTQEEQQTGTIEEQPGNTYKNDKNAKKREKGFKKPTLSEVADYCKDRGNSIDPQHFIDYNDSRGWLVGKSKMKDWRAAIRTWERTQTTSATFSSNSQEIAELLPQVTV